jgi:hypothetical protein
MALSTGRRRTALCLALLALLPFVLFWPVTLLQRVFAEGDLFEYNYPLLHTIAEQWKAGRAPLWNPYIFGGTPLHGNMQGGAFYLPNLLLMLVPGWMGYQYGILLHYSLAGAFTFLYLRALSLARTAALFGAIVFMLGGFGMGSLGHVSTLRAYPWLPLILLGLEKWRQTGDRRHWMLGGTAMGLMLVAGHPQIPLYALLVSGAYAGAVVVGAAGGRRARLGAGCALGFLVGAGLAAVQILPTLQLAAQEYMRPSDRSYEYFVSYSLHPALLANLVFPRILPCNEAELAVYVGISTLVLALLGAWRVPSESRAHRTFFVFVALVSLVLAFGEWTPLSRLLFRLPLYNLFTCPGRNLFEFDFAIAVLAAFGVQALRSPGVGAGSRGKAVLAFVLLAGLGLGTLALVRELAPPAGRTVDGLDEMTWGHPAVSERLPFVLASLGLVGLFPAARRRWRAAASCALLVLLVFDVFSYARDIYRLSPPTVYTNRPAVLAFLHSRPERGRVLFLEQSPDDNDQKSLVLSPDSNAVHQVESINGFDSLMLRQIDQASGHVMPTYGFISGAAAYNQPQFQRFMDLLDTRYVLAPAGRTLELAPPRYRPVYADALEQVFENTEALPRFFLVPQVRPATPEQALDVLASGRWDGGPFDPRQIALVEGALRMSPLPGRAHPSMRVDVLEEMGGHVRLRVDSSDRALLVHSTNHSKGWRALVDGVAAPVYRVDGLLQGVEIPGGSHEVRFEYRPGAFVLGVAFSLLAVGLVGGALARRPRRGPAAPQDRP